MNKQLQELCIKLDDSMRLSSLFKKKKLREEFISLLIPVENELSSIPIIKKQKSNLVKVVTIQKNEHSILETKLSKISSKLSKQGTELSELNIKQTLITKLLSEKSTNQGLRVFSETLNVDFQAFANKVSSLANEAEILLKLQSLEKELELISAYPELHTKTVIAVGGGFSAGKSEFISSFIDSDVKLPIGINPTTAIPTYVLHQKTNKFISCTNQGGVIDLEEIDKDFQNKLSHNFISTFGFNLKEIMPFIILGTQLNYDQVCFIDTPGYNPADTSGGYTHQDMDTAKTFLENANHFFWLIGLDANGTISASDIDFLESLDLDNKKLFVVLNKADIRPKDSLEEILDIVEETLEDESIYFEGISAYSSIEQKEYAYRGTSLYDYFDEHNIESKKQDETLNKLFDVYRAYRFAILKAIHEKETIKSQLHSLSLDILEEGGENNSAHERINNLKRFLSTDLQKDNLEKLDEVILRMKDAIDTVFGKNTSISLDKISLPEVKIDFDFSISKILDSELEKLEQDKKDTKEKHSRKLSRFILKLKKVTDINERNELICKAKEKGISVENITKETGLAESTIRRILSKKNSPKPSGFLWLTRTN